MTETYLKDPLGMLSRAPELEAVARADAGVAAALARGSAHGLYRTLWWGRLTGRLKAHRIVIDQLLSHRRLFVAKAGAPVLGSLNGIGATVYGDSDHDTDGTYVKTHFLILVFVPIFPFAQYLVSDAPEKGKAWYFLGKVPLSGPVWFWNRLVVTGVIVGMGAGLFQGFYATKHHDIQIVNGLPKGVHVRAGEKEIDVPAFGREVVNLPAGRQSIKVSADSKEIESGSFDIKPGSSVQIWNVLGAAPIFRETVYYTANGVKPPESQAKIHCGDVQIDTPWADYVFIEPPATLSLPENQASEAKQHVGIDSGGIAACVGAFAAPERSAAAVALAKGLVTVDDSVSSLGQAILLLQLGGKPELAVPMLKEAVEKHDNSVEHHRLYQSTAQSLGAGAGLLDDYRKRREAQPDSADAAYLYDRLLPRVEVAEDARKLVARYPDHIQINRLAAFVLMREHRFDEA
ncbi:MAG: hypothetical protein ABI672_17405, partial [Vicinamibacteria bacterium]